MRRMGIFAYLKNDPNNLSKKNRTPKVLIQSVPNWIKLIYILVGSFWFHLESIGPKLWPWDFFLTNSIIFGVIYTRPHLFFYKTRKNQWNSPKFVFSSRSDTWHYDTNKICLVTLKFWKLWYIIFEKNGIFFKILRKLSTQFFFSKFYKITKFKYFFKI